MAVWQPRVMPETESGLRKLGAYEAPHAGILGWSTARGFAWPWTGSAHLRFVVHPRATDADYPRLLDVWRQVCDCRETVLAIIREIVCENSRTLAETKLDDATPGDIMDYLRGCTFVLSTSGPGRIAIEVEVCVPGSTDDVVRIDLVANEKLSWHME